MDVGANWWSVHIQLCSLLALVYSLSFFIRSLGIKSPYESTLTMAVNAPVQHTHPESRSRQYASSHSTDLGHYRSSDHHSDFPAIE